MSYYLKRIANEVAEEIHTQGLRVFMGESGTYGFFTNQIGTRVVSFQVRLGVVSFSGNYKTDTPSRAGNGWQLGELLPCATPDDKSMLEQTAPDWALGSAKVIRYTTLEDHLHTYLKSSRYQPYKRDYDLVSFFAYELYQPVRGKLTDKWQSLSEIQERYHGDFPEEVQQVLNTYVELIGGVERMTEQLTSAGDQPSGFGTLYRLHTRGM